MEFDDYLDDDPQLIGKLDLKWEYFILKHPLDPKPRCWWYNHSDTISNYLATNNVFQVSLDYYLIAVESVY